MKKNDRHPILFIICYLSYTAIYIARLNLSVAAPGIISAGIADEAQIGALGSIFSVIYAVGRLINGKLSDKTAPWKMVSIGLAAAGISNIIIGLHPSVPEMFFLWMINSYAQSMLWSSLLCILARIYTKQRALRNTTFLVSSVSVGNIFGIVINMVLIVKLGLRFAFIVPGALTLIFGGLILLSVRKVTAPKDQAVGTKSFSALLKDKRICSAIFPAMFHGVMKDNISIWMVLYMVKKFDINLNKSAYFVLFIPAVGFIGRLLYPVCYTLSKGRENVISTRAFLVCIVSSVCLCTKFISPVTSVICLSLIYAAVSIINTSMLSIFPLHFAEYGCIASVSGIMDFATYLGAGISTFIYGIVIKHYGFNIMFLSWIVLSIISVCILRSFSESNEKGTMQ